jgi:hypothetical protein
MQTPVDKELVKKLVEKNLIQKLRDAHIERDRQIDIEEMLKFYRTDPSGEYPPEGRDNFKEWINSVFEKIVVDSDFLKIVFCPDLFLKLNKNEYMGRILSIMKDCAIQLFNKMIEEKLEWNFNTRKYTYYIVIACLSIAVKNIGAHDWLNDDKIIFSQIIKALNKSIKPVPKQGETPKKDINFDLEICKQIEFDILKITGWKGCNMYDLKEDYTDYFKYTETEDKFDIPDKTISSELSKDIKAIIGYEEAKKKAGDSKPKRLPLPLPKNMPKKSPSPKSKKMSKSPSPKSPKKSPSKSAFKKKKRV